MWRLTRTANGRAYSWAPVGPRSTDNWLAALTPRGFVHTRHVGVASGLSAVAAGWCTSAISESESVARAVKPDLRICHSLCIVCDLSSHTQTPGKGGRGAKVTERQRGTMRGTARRDPEAGTRRAAGIWRIGLFTLAAALPVAARASAPRPRTPPRPRR